MADASSRFPATITLSDLFDVDRRPSPAKKLVTSFGSRLQFEAGRGVLVQLDAFAPFDQGSCAFVRIELHAGQVLRFAAKGRLRTISCAGGGWLLLPEDERSDAYWIPRGPCWRTFDGHERILQEQPAAITSFDAGVDQLAVEFAVPRARVFNWVLWRFPAASRATCEELQRLCNLERAPTFLWSSQASVALPADLYLHLVEGRVYQNARAWPRQWKFCCELDAYEIFLRLTGLRRATGKRLYELLRRQVLLSVLARQAEDGAWYHGEWTDMNECHYRFHDGALLLLENALDEWSDETLRRALVRGAAFVASKTDRTDAGLWFLHDSLEGNPAALDEMHRQTGSIVKGHGAWKPSAFLGKDPTNKMILNTHVDTTVVLSRYRRIVGDAAHDAKVSSALGSARWLLAQRPAERVYRGAFALLGLTLRPAAEASKLALPVRALKRLVWMYLVPNLYRLKHRWPRFVMPTGFIDRHLAPMHFDAKYHSVNLMDLARLLREFPEEELAPIVAAAIRFVVDDGQRTMRWWADARPRHFAIVVFAEAMYHLCMLERDGDYEKHLAQALLCGFDLGLGMPPSLLGGNAEITPTSTQQPCPSPGDPRLLIANLSAAGRCRLLVVNASREDLPLDWDLNPAQGLTWNGGMASAARFEPGVPVIIPARGYLVGQRMAPCTAVAEEPTPFRIASSSDTTVSP